MRDLERRELKDGKKADAAMKRDLVEGRETRGQEVRMDHTLLKSKGEIKEEERRRSKSN